MDVPRGLLRIMLAVVSLTPVPIIADQIHRLTAGDTVAELAVDTSRLHAQYGPRFDRTAMVVSIRRAGREYLDPRGLCDEFGFSGRGVLGYDEASPDGGEFLKIGVGVLRRDTAEAYKFSRIWPIVRLLEVEVHASPSSLLVRQNSPEVQGFAYSYEKHYELGPDGTLLIKYKLTNTGPKPFAFDQYNHNFFSFAGAIADPGYAVVPAFPVEVKGDQGWSYNGAELRLRREAPARPGVYFGQDLELTAAVNRVTLRHTNGQWVECAGDFPAVRFAVWATLPTVCPEIFHRAQVSPGATITWQRSYRFGYALPGQTP